MTEHHSGTVHLTGEGNAPTPSSVNLGRHAYEAYAGATGWRSAVSGDQLPRWDEQSAEIRGAWETAGMAVASLILD